MKVDWVSEWFSGMRECGENISIIYGRQKKNIMDETPYWYELPHDNFDGISGLAHLLRTQHCAVNELPMLRNDKYTFLRALRGLLNVIPTLGIRKQFWLCDFNWEYEPSLRTVEKRLAWNIFSEDETRKVIALAKASDVTLNTYLLFHLDAAVAQQLTGISKNRLWMIPVNLRGVIKRDPEVAPKMSYLGVDLTSRISLVQLQSKITRLKKNCFHWGTWTLFNSLFLLGKAGIRKDILDRKKKHHGWTGTFSNLGNWEVANSDNWIFCPTVSSVHPIGAGCITMNGRTAIAVQLHEALNADLTTTQLIIDLWKNSCLSLTATQAHVTLSKTDIESNKNIPSASIGEVRTTQ